MRFHTLDDWLNWQQGLHPSAIDLGLERVREVAGRLDLLAPGCPVITVGGTNGKGSCVGYLSSILSRAGHRLGAYTSPHLVRYNERIRIGGAEATDAELVAAFDRVDRARGDISLTYFEFGTLAALDLFRRAKLDAWVLEVGLGGRLDAVNIIDADVAVVTSVGLDHTEWLGPDRESIGREKAGIFRAGRPAIYAEPDAPASVLAQAAARGAELRLAGRDYQVLDDAPGWRLRAPGLELTALPEPGLVGARQRFNAAAAVLAVRALGDRLPVTEAALRAGIAGTRVSGRFQVLPGAVEWILDVAHNRDSIRELAASLRARPVSGPSWAVFAQMRRKELGPVLEQLGGVFAGWFLPELPDADARPAAEIAAGLAAAGEKVLARAPAPALLDEVRRQVGEGGQVVVFGSFRTVEEALRWRGLGDA